MRIEKIPLDRINPAPYNPREDLQPDDPDYIAIKTSIDKFGLVDPLVWNEATGNLVGGHQRYKIIEASGAAEAWCSVVRLAEAEEKELNFALNRALGRWHLPRLETLVGELKSLDVDIAYLRPEELLQPPSLGGEVEEDDVPPVPQEPRSRRGEVYGLGRHRLICGDATSAEDVAQLMGGEKADMVFTSPPYNGASLTYPRRGKRRELYNIYPDSLSSEEYINFNISVLKNLFSVVVDEGSLFYNLSYNARTRWEYLAVALAAIREAQWTLLETIVWKKRLAMPIPGNHLTRKSELVFWFAHNGRNVCINKGTFEVVENVWELDNYNAQEIELAACFPVALPAKGIALCSPEKGAILDPFGGSGSTLIACEQLGRRCFMMEIDPLYCDVIRDRYAKFVGQAADEAPKRDFVPVPPLEEATSKGPPPAPKAPPQPTSAPEPPPKRDPPEDEDDEEDYKEAFELIGHRWRIKADQASKIVGCTPDLIQAPGGCGGHCCKTEMWPALSGRPELQHCYWLGPKGCKLQPQDKPVTCHRYPFVVNRKGEFVLHWRLQGDVDYPCLYGRGDKMAIEALRGSIVALFGESEYAAALQSVRAGQDYDIAVPQHVALAQLRERKWAHANAIPVPRTLFDDGNAAVLDRMPRDKIEASMACLDGKGGKKGAAGAAPKPAPVSAFQVGDADDVDTTDPASLPLPGAPPAPEPEVVKSGPQGLDEAPTPTAEEITKNHSMQGIAFEPLPEIDPAAGERESEPATLEEVAAKKGIFEALQRPVPPHTEANPELVLDFETPVEAHALPRGGTVYVKRDDLFNIAGVRGGKARTCWALAMARPTKGLITAGSRQSPQCNIVAHIARRLGVPCRLHIPKAKAALEGELAEAEVLGAEIVQHKPGYNTVIVKRARDDAAAHPTWTLIPFGMECREAVEQTRRQAQVLERYGRICERMVVPVGSGMSLAGILWGMRDAGAPGTLPVLGICVGANPRRRLDEYAPRGWRDTVTLKDAPADYHKPATRTRLGDLELDPGYEAKCLPYLKAGDLLWVVGIRNSMVGHQGLK